MFFLHVVWHLKITCFSVFEFIRLEVDYGIAQRLTLVIVRLLKLKCILKQYSDMTDGRKHCDIGVNTKAWSPNAFSTFSGTRFQTNLKKNQTNSDKFWMVQCFPENVSDFLSKCV